MFMPGILFIAGPPMFILLIWFGPVMFILLDAIELMVVIGPFIGLPKLLRLFPM